MDSTPKKKETPALHLQAVGDAEIPYLYYKGENAAPHILFVHATGFMPWLWQPVIEEFSPPGNVWAPFICNYRQCDPEKGGLSWDVIARDLAEFCRLQQISKPLVVGHSMGATVLTFACALYDLQPRAMVLIEPIFLPEKFYQMKFDLADHPLASKSIRRTSSWLNEKEAWMYLKSRALFASWDEQVLNLYFKYGMQRQENGSLHLTCSPESEAAIFMGGRKYNPWPMLDKLKCPVLIVEGEESENKEFIDLKKAASLLSHGVYKSMAGAGHLLAMQKPQELVKLIKEFNNQIESNIQKGETIHGSQY